MFFMCSLPFWWIRMINTRQALGKSWRIPKAVLYFLAIGLLNATAIALIQWIVTATRDRQTDRQTDRSIDKPKERTTYEAGTLKHAWFHKRHASPVTCIIHYRYIHMYYRWDQISVASHSSAYQRCNRWSLQCRSNDRDRIVPRAICSRPLYW